MLLNTPTLLNHMSYVLEVRIGRCECDYNSKEDSPPIPTQAQIAHSNMATQSQFVEAIPLNYPKVVSNDTARKVYINKSLTKNPEMLFADVDKDVSISNLVFYTNQPHTCHKAITSQSQRVKAKESVGIYS